MKKLLFCLAILAGIMSCSTDLTDVEERISQLENQLATLKNEGNSLEQQIQNSKERYEQLLASTQDLEAKRKGLEALMDSLQYLSVRLDSLLGAQIELMELQNSMLDEQNVQIGEQASLIEAQGSTNAKLEEEIQALKDQQKDLQDLINATQQELDALIDEMEGVDPKIHYFDFLSTDNPVQLVDDVRCEIIGDSVLQCRGLNVMTSKRLVPRFAFDGNIVKLDDGTELVSGITACDFSVERKIVVSTETKSRTYYVVVYSYTGLPTLWLETNKRATVKVAGENYRGTFKLVSNTNTRADLSTIETNMYLRGISPIRWYVPKVSEYEQPGKTYYEIDLTTAQQLFGESTATGWCLHNNYYDQSMIHNQTAFFMGTISKLDYTPRYHYVDLLLNGHYHGVYMLGDRLEAATDRVNVGATGFILSIDEEAGSRAFYTSRISRPISILSPASISTTSETYISNYVREAESVLFSSNFRDVDSGWQKYLDMDSFVDWYLINEIAKNSNGAFKNHCVMHMRRGEKLKMGPLWDFERAFNNNSKSVSTQSFVLKDEGWFARLFQDPAFVAKVKERFNYFYAHEDDILNNINENAQYLKYAIAEDNCKWGTFDAYVSMGYDTWTLYQGSVVTMKNWLIDRMEWLKSQFDAM